MKEIKFERLEELFDTLLLKTIAKGLSYEELNKIKENEKKGHVYIEHEKVREWQSKYGFKFNVYSNEHLIEGKKHFHFDHNADNIHCKYDFNGNVLEVVGTNAVKPKIEKDLQYFLEQEGIQETLNNMWDRLNPIINNQNA